MRRLIVLALLLAPVAAAAQKLDGPVAGGAFGMSGADYFGDIHDRPPLDPEAAPARVKRHRVASAARSRPAKVRPAGRRNHL